MINKHGREQVERLTQVTKPMREWNVSFITTAGVHLKTDHPFDVDGGDWGVKFIPHHTPEDDLTITHTHYDTSSADQDVNCVFPIKILKNLVEKGTIGEVSQTLYGMMGYIPRVDKLMNESIPIILKKLKEDNVDVVLLSPG